MNRLVDWLALGGLPLGALVSVATGLAYSLGIFEGTVLAVRSMEGTFERPVRPDESVTLVLTVLQQDPRARPDRGRVRFGVKLLNPAGKTVMSGNVLSPGRPCAMRSRCSPTSNPSSNEMPNCWKRM